MEPNQGMADQPSMQPTPTQPIQPIEQPAQSGNDIAFQDKPKKNTGIILGMVLLLLLAAGGIGFGVWAMMDGNSQKDSLNKQIASLKEQSDKCLEQISDSETDDNINQEKSEDKDTSINTNNYIYVGEWGLKIKIPEGLSIKNYAFNTEAAAGGPITRISVRLENGDYGEYYLGVVTRTPKSNYDESLDRPYEPAFSDDEYYYIVSHPNGEIPTYLQSEMELISNMLSNSDNYSKI